MDGILMLKNKVKDIDGIPIWEYLKNNAVKKETELTNKDFGKFSEIIGSRITWNFNKSGILNDVFPNISNFC
jgi:glutathione peroxidase-family protein